MNAIFLKFTQHLPEWLRPTSDSPAWVDYAKNIANTCAFVGAVLLTSPAIAVQIPPFILFLVCHLLWMCASIRSADRHAFSLNFALLPFDFLAIAGRF